MSKKKKVTLKTVAEKVGCSISVASTVLNGSKGNTWVSPDMRDKVDKTAKGLGYTPSYHAQSLKTGRSNAIGLMLAYPGKSMPWIVNMSEGVQRGAYEKGYDLIAIGPRDNKSELERGLQYAREGRIDAVLAPGRKFRLSEFDVSSFDIPFCLTDGDFYNTGLPVIRVDETPGIEKAVIHLSSLGHTEILWLSLKNSEGTESLPERRNTIRNKARDLNMHMNEIRIPSPKKTGRTALIANALKNIETEMDTFPSVTAVICYNELMGFALYEVCKRRAIRIPEDISVIGFDNFEADLTIPPMSTVSIMLHEMGRRAALQAIEMINNPGLMKSLKGKRIDVAAELVTRDSTGPTAGISPFI